MSEKSRMMAMEEARIKALNRPPETLDVPDDLEQLVRDYNETEALQKARLEQLLGACLQPGGPHRVEFGLKAWSNIRYSDGRFDIAVNAFVDPYISYITKIE